MLVVKRAFFCSAMKRDAERGCWARCLFSSSFLPANLRLICLSTLSLVHRFGDLSKLSLEQLAAFDATVMASLKWVKMQPGDVVLLDNYMCMHGRNIFDGVRKHAVTWFK